jgi:hypothetical protein
LDLREDIIEHCRIMHELQYFQRQGTTAKLCEHDKIHVTGYKTGRTEKDWEGVVSTGIYQISTCVLYSLCGCLHKLNAYINIISVRLKSYFIGALF